MRRWIVWSLALASASLTSSALAGGADDGAVKKAMEDEMARSMTSLKLGSEGPPYYLRYTLTDSDRFVVEARLGALVEKMSRENRSIRADARVGSPEEDNTNFRGSSSGWPATGSREDDAAALRRNLWLITDLEYKRALESLARKKASHAVQAADKDKIPDFAKAEPLQSTTDKAIVPTDADKKKLEELSLKLSALFREFPAVDSGVVESETNLVRRRLLTSEKTWTDERRSRVEILVRGDTIAEDGQRLTASVDFTAGDVASLPPFEKMQAEVRAMAKHLTDERKAPNVEAGSASVLFEGMAAPQLMRLLLASPLSGQPIPRSAGDSSPTDGSTSFADKIGQNVAPKWLSVTDDPTALGPNKRLLFGGYDSDDEGVKAERVPLIENGVLKTLLMSRTPRKEIPKSNGHGRLGFGVRAAAGNLFVTATGGKDRAALLSAAARSAGPKGTVYVVRELGEGSGIGRGQTLQVRVAVRIKDGKEEPVRGLSLEGFVPKTLKKDLVAAGKELFVLDDDGHGAPMSVVSPALLFEDVDVGKPNDKNKTPPLYASPLSAK